MTRIFVALFFLVSSLLAQAHGADQWDRMARHCSAKGSADAPQPWPIPWTVTVNSLNKDLERNETTECAAVITSDVDFVASASCLALPSDVSTNAMIVQYRDPSGNEGLLTITEVNVLSANKTTLLDDVVLVTVVNSEKLASQSPVCFGEGTSDSPSNSSVLVCFRASNASVDAKLNTSSSNDFHCTLVPKEALIDRLRQVGRGEAAVFEHFAGVWHFLGFATKEAANSADDVTPFRDGFGGYSFPRCASKGRFPHAQALLKRPSEEASHPPVPLGPGPVIHREAQSSGLFPILVLSLIGVLGIVLVVHILTSMRRRESYQVV